MNEAQVSLDHSTYPLPRPFMVLATQNPREYYGTYPLPESQLDRFLLRIRIGYPAAADEKAMLRGERRRPAERSMPVVEADDVLGLQEAADKVRVDERSSTTCVALVAATRRSPLLALGREPARLARPAARRPRPRARRRPRLPRCPTTSRRWRCPRSPTA